MNRGIVLLTGSGLVAAAAVAVIYVRMPDGSTRAEERYAFLQKNGGAPDELCAAARAVQADYAKARNAAGYRTWKSRADAECFGPKVATNAAPLVEANAAAMTGPVATSMEVGAASVADANPEPPATADTTPPATEDQTPPPVSNESSRAAVSDEDLNDLARSDEEECKAEAEATGEPPDADCDLSDDQPDNDED